LAKALDVLFVIRWLKPTAMINAAYFDNFYSLPSPFMGWMKEAEIGL
jgi:hypothetical protein